jgi:hypothetical protein
LLRKSIKSRRRKMSRVGSRGIQKIKTGVMEEKLL